MSSRVAAWGAAAMALTLLAGCGTTVPAAQRAATGGASASDLSGSASSPSATGAEVSQAPGAGSSPVSGATVPGSSGSSIAAGSTGSSPGSTGSSTGGGATPLSGPSAGLSTGSQAPAKGQPIQIGFIVTNVSNAGSLGVNAGQTFSDQQLYAALVAATNAHGGLDGHPIVPVYGVTDTASANWGTDFQAACAKFTQDNHVAAVIGYIFVYLDSFEQCLAKAGVAHLYGGYQPGDTAEQSSYPDLVATTNPTGELHWEIGLSGAVQSRLLTPQHKLGVVVDSCANDDKAFQKVGAPYLTAQHIPYEAFYAGCAQGASDDGTAVSEIQSAELRFRADGVDTVYVEGVPALLFAEAAESQGWHPTYLMTVGGAAFEGNVPSDQLTNFHGFGWMPSVDVDPSHQPYPWDTSERSCLSLLASQGLVPKDYNDFMEAFTTCDGLNLYAAALAADGGSTAASSVVPALAAAIPKTQLASTYGGAGQYDAAEHGGPAMWRQWGWSGGCGCFEYTGPAYPVPTLTGS